MEAAEDAAAGAGAAAGVAAGAAADAAAGAAAGAAAAGATPEEDKRPGWAKDMDLSVGDSVCGQAKRFQDMWNDKEGTVIGLLSSKCKVKIETEGKTYGQFHLYEPKHVQKIARKRPARATDNLPAAAPEPPSKKRAP